MKKTKSFLKSKTIWGILIMIAPVLSNFLGFDLIPIFQDQKITGEELFQIAGALLAIAGRFGAKQEIHIL